MNPRPEAVAAAAWWTARLGAAEHDLGPHDPKAMDSSLLANMVTAALNHQFTEEQRGAYRDALAVVIEEHLLHWETGLWEGGWRPDAPSRGSANRVILNDYGPDRVLTDAAERSGVRIGRLDFPLKTVMWINPGQVIVREGYGGDRIIVWAADTDG